MDGLSTREHKNPETNPGNPPSGYFSQFSSLQFDWSSINPRSNQTSENCRRCDKPVFFLDPSPDNVPEAIEPEENIVDGSRLPLGYLKSIRVSS
jgi:hypothetical protein